MQWYLFYINVITTVTVQFNVELLRMMWELVKQYKSLSSNIRTCQIVQELVKQCKNLLSKSCDKRASQTVQKDANWLERLWNNIRAC